jgi:enoyl-CoA hydratase/carnithine racemase
MAKLVTLERPSEGVAVVTLGQAEIHNCVSYAGVSQLADAIRDAREGGARICVLASGGPGHWFEHAWLADLHGIVTAGAVSGDAMGWFRALAEITHDEVITIAAISGDCSGGGAELGWACDLRIAEEQASFTQPEVQIGLSTGIGGTSRLMRLIGPTATAEMVLDGSPVPARRIHDLGGVNRVVPTGEAVAVALEWARRLAERPASALVVEKKVLKAAHELPLGEALANEQRLFQTLLGSQGTRERMRGIQERLDAGESFRDIYGNIRD